MAYIPQYTANFTNELFQEVLVTISKNDGEVIEIVNYDVVSLTLSARSEEQGEYAPVIWKELSLSLWATNATSLSWETFITSAHDDWKIEVIVDGTTIFTGFVTPNQGFAPFQDKPYEINIKATDGLKLLKNIELVNIDGDYFNNFSTVIEYLAACLYQTGLELPIRVYCGYFHDDMLDKADSIHNDMLQQAVLAARSFVASHDSYENCWDALNMILNGWAHVEQYEGRWQIVTLSERQYIPGSRYYVDYDPDGVAHVGYIDTEDAAKVGKSELIYPINETQIISCSYANKTTNTIFEYKVPPSQMINQAFRFLGDELDSGSGYVRYETFGWLHKDGNLTSLADFPQSDHGIYVREDSTGAEESRDMLVYYDSGATGDLKSCVINSNDDSVLNEGDEIELNFEWQSGSNPVIPYDTAQVAILREGFDGSSSSHWWTLGYETDGTGDNYPKWFNDSTHYVIGTDNTSSTLMGVWRTLNVEKTIVPASGILYIRLGGHTDSVAWILWRPIVITVTPKIAETRRIVKGEKFMHSQDAKYPTVHDNKITIDATVKRGLKGTMYKYDESTVHKSTFDKDWYRYGATEERHFKELIDLGKFNQSYRQFYKIEGDFTSFFYNTVSDELVRRPLGFHKTYRFMDMSTPRDFILVPSLEIDLVTGNCACAFLEVIGNENDGTEEGDSRKFNYIFQ